MATKAMSCGTVIVLALVGSVLAVLLISRVMMPPPAASPSHFKPAPRKASRPEPTSSQVKAREEAEAKQMAAQERQRKREEAKRLAVQRQQVEASRRASQRLREEARQQAKRLAHRIVRRQDVSYGGCRRMVYRVLVNVESIPSETALRELAEHLWRSGNQEWDEFSVWIYLPGMEVESVWYAGAEYRPHGLKEFRIQKEALEETKWE